MRLQLQAPDWQCQAAQGQEGSNRTGRLSERAGTLLGLRLPPRTPWSPPVGVPVPRPGQREQDGEKTWPLGVARASAKSLVCLGGELSCEDLKGLIDMHLDPHFLLLALSFSVCETDKKFMGIY